MADYKAARLTEAWPLSENAMRGRGIVWLPYHAEIQQLSKVRRSMYTFTEFEEIEKTIGRGRYAIAPITTARLMPNSPSYRSSFYGILGALQTNWARVQQLAVFPTYLMQEAMRHQLHLAKASFNVLGRVEIGRVEKAQEQALWDEYDRLPVAARGTRERAGTDDFANRDSGIAL